MNHLQTLHHFKTVLPAEDFVATGTFALKTLGFDIKVKDLDIVLVKPAMATLEVLENLEKSNPPKNLLTGYPTALGEKKVFRFIHEGVELDVFISHKGVPHTVRTGCGIKIADLNYIINAKKGLNRPKDYMQLLKLRDSILTDEEFKTYLKHL